jgi:hypothetical protein
MLAHADALRADLLRRPAVAQVTVTLTRGRSNPA